jgi:hypothetical protein
VPCGGVVVVHSALAPEPDGAALGDPAVGATAVGGAVVPGCEQADSSTSAAHSSVTRIGWVMTEA